MNALFEGEQGLWMRRAGLLVLVLLAVFLLVKVFADIKGLHYIGAGIPAMNTITVEGDGEAVAVPDIATFTFSVVETAKTVAEAQDKATKKMEASVAYLKEQKIDDKDIKTVDYSVNPQYEWQNAVCSSVAGTYCPQGKSVLTGYQVRQMVEVKVRDTKQAGTLLSGVGEKGASELSGLTFSLDDKDKVVDEARNEAIEKAKTKAEALADGLDVTLVRIVNFSDNSGGYYPPMAYDSYGRGGALMSEAKVAAPVPTPEGQNKYTSHVTITYEIR